VTRAAEPEPAVRKPPGLIFWVAFLWAVLGAVFLVLAVFARYYDYFPSDVFIAHRIQNIDVPAFGGYVDFVNVVGNGWVLIALALIGAAALVLARAWTEAAVLLIAIGPRLANSVVKDAVQRPRPSPELVHVSDHANDFSFPSGHTVGTSVLFGVLFFVLPAVVPSRPLRWLLQLGCLLLIASAGPARVYVGVHWPSDALASYLLALLFLVPACLAYQALSRTRIRSQPQARMLD
jgi:undecaprenyl-diphosphatase